jgi:hypothetical protein
LKAAERFDTPLSPRDNPNSLPYQRVLEAKLDDKLHQMLRDLRRALSEAISESPDVNRTLRKIREEGYSLYLLVDCKRDSNDADPLPIGSLRQATRSLQGGQGGEPNFLIDGRDLSFLRSIGIDPTRRLRRRRSNSNTSSGV